MIRCLSFLLCAFAGLAGLLFTVTGQAEQSGQLRWALYQVADVSGTGSFGAVDGKNSTFTLSTTPVGVVFVFYNGLLQTPGQGYTISGNSLKLSWTPIAGDTVVAMYFSNAS